MGTLFANRILGVVGRFKGQMVIVTLADFLVMPNHRDGESAPILRGVSAFRLCTHFKPIVNISSILWKGIR